MKYSEEDSIRAVEQLKELYGSLLFDFQPAVWCSRCHEYTHHIKVLSVWWCPKHFPGRLFHWWRRYKV